MTNPCPRHLDAVQVHNAYAAGGITFDVITAFVGGGSGLAVKGTRTLTSTAAKAARVGWMDGGIPSGSRVTHGSTFTRIGDDPISVRNSQNVANDGLHDVVAHGTRDGFLDLDEGLANGGQIVDAVRSNPSYSGCGLRLMVCHSGASGIGQQIANEMGVIVKAPTDKVGTIPVLGPGQTPVIANGGYWRTFLPMVW